MRRFFISALFWLLPACICNAQEIAGALAELLEQAAESESGSAAEELQQWYESLLLHPVNINAATRSRLEELQILSLFQIESLQEYIAEYGAILSFSELAKVDGFNAETVAALRPLITLEDSGPSVMEAYSQVRARMKWKSSQEGLYRYARYLGGAGRFSYGLTLETDALEGLWPDFISAHAQYDAGRFKLLLGDFSARYGQGLAMDKSFSMSALGSPAAVIKRRNDFKGYTSTGENDAFRGVALYYDFGAAGRVQAFLSAAPLDATVTDSTYSSLPATGYHRTDHQKSQKDALREFVACVNYTVETSRLQLALTAAGYGYDKHNARRVQEYNRFQMYDGMYGNVALSALYSAGHLRYYGEAAMDMGGTPAVLAGAVWSPGYNFEGSLQVRVYPKSYIAAHAGAYSSLSTVSNQAGVLVNLLARPLTGMTITAMGDAAWHPHVRYLIDRPSFVASLKARCEYAAGLWSVYIQDNYTFKDYEDSHRHALKLYASVQPSQTLSVSARADCVLLLTGAVAGGEKGYRLERGSGVSLRTDWRMSPKAALWGSVTLFDSGSSATRIYAYEKDLPQSFSVVAYGGRGLSASLLFSFNILNDLKLSVKAAATAFGQEDKDSVYELRGQLDWSFK